MANLRPAMGDGGDALRRRLMQSDFSSSGDDSDWSEEDIFEMEEITGVDRFSLLPKSIVHYIMSSIPWEDAIRMTALSKHFFALWKSFPMIEFDYYKYQVKNPEQVELKDFKNFLTRSLALRELTTDLERFTLTADFENDSNDPDAAAVIETAVTYAINNNVKDLVVNCEESNPAGLPGTVFESESIKKLVLSGLKLNDRKMMFTCPLLEDLTLTDCLAMNAIIGISCPNLKIAKINGMRNAAKIRMDPKTAKIESFIYNGGKIRSIRRCEIVNLSACKSLKTAAFETFDGDDEWFKKEVLNLPLLETLKLKECFALTTIEMQNNSLEVLELEVCEKLLSVLVDAPKLERFSYFSRSYSSGDCKVDLRKCRNMKELILKGCARFVTDEWMAQTIPRFRYLEKLMLYSCESVESIWIHSAHLISVDVICCKNIRNFEIYAPTLVSFVYEGKVLPTTPATVLSTKLNAVLRLSDCLKNTEQKELRDFLSFFGHCKTLTLVFYRDEPLIYSLAMRLKMVSPMYDLKHLIIKLTRKKSPIDAIVESLMWLAPHPRTISIFLQNKPFLTLQTEESGDEEDTDPCCISCPIKCWRHYASEVAIKAYPEFKERESLESFFFYSAKNPITITDAKNIEIN